MTPQQIVALFVRLFAIWLAVMTFQIWGVLVAIPMGVDTHGPMMWLIPVIPLVCAFLAWKFPLSIANKLIKPDHDNTVLKLPARSAAAVGSAVLGMWAILNALPHVWGMAALLVTTMSDGMYPGASAMSILGTQEMGFVVLAALGLWMVFKPWTIARRIFPDGE